MFRSKPWIYTTLTFWFLAILFRKDKFSSLSASDNALLVGGLLLYSVLVVSIVFGIYGFVIGVIRGFHRRTK